MAQISKVLRDTEDNGLMFMCPACNDVHMIRHGNGNGPRWSWNGDIDHPTFNPSIMVEYPAVPDAEPEFKEWRQKRLCHSFVINGRIKFLDDCTHNMKGQTVNLAEWVVH